MKITVILVACLLFVAVIGCSDEQKEEANKLSEELQGLEGQADTSHVITGEDSLADSTTAIVEETMPEVEAPEQTMPPAPTGDGYTVQVASCESADYARHLIDLYGKRGYEAFVSTTTFNDQTYYRVRIGNYTSISEAQNLQAELKDKYSIEPWVDVLGN